MPRNLELKASVQSLELTRSRARDCGATFEDTLIQVDTYFNVSHGRLKLRQIAGQGAELIYYERHETTSERWSTYSTVDVQAPDVLKDQLTSALGVRAVVSKRRELYLFDGARIHIDDVQGLGSFLEFEVPAFAQREASKKMKFLREQFLVTEPSIFAGSYCDLILAKTQGLGA